MPLSRVVRTLYKALMKSGQKYGRELGSNAPILPQAEAYLYVKAPEAHEHISNHLTNYEEGKATTNFIFPPTPSNSDSQQRRDKNRRKLSKRERRFDEKLSALSRVLLRMNSRLARSIIRQQFKQPIPDGDEKKLDQRIDDGFACLRELNKRLQVFPKLTYLSQSDATTRGIARVRVECRWQPQLTAIEKFCYTYRVTIMNVSQDPKDTFQLLSRTWRITDLDGKVETVQGPGVLGKQPVLRPGESHTYESYAMLDYPLGVMEGSYQMTLLDRGGELFDAEIQPFALLFPLTESLFEEGK